MYALYSDRREIKLLFCCVGYSLGGCAVTNLTSREISSTHFCFSLLLYPRIIGAERVSL